jgi:hypothetical protein
MMKEHDENQYGLMMPSTQYDSARPMETDPRQRRISNHRSDGMKFPWAIASKTGAS